MAFDPTTAHFWLGDEDLGTFNYPQMPVGEARFFKKITGMTPMQMMEGFEIGDPDAMAALVWLLWRHKGKHVDFNAVNFGMGDLTVKDADGHVPSNEELEEATQTGPTVAPTRATLPDMTSKTDDFDISLLSGTSAISDLVTSTT